MPWREDPGEINYHMRPKRDYAAEAVARFNAKIEAIFRDTRSERIKAKLIPQPKEPEHD